MKTNQQTKAGVTSLFYYEPSY